MKSILAILLILFDIIIHYYLVRQLFLFIEDIQLITNNIELNKFPWKNIITKPLIWNMKKLRGLE